MTSVFRHELRGYFHTLTAARIKTDHTDIYELSRDLFLTFRESPHVILEMSLKKGTLEDVFLELTDAEPPPLESVDGEIVQVGGEPT